MWFSFNLIDVKMWTDKLKVYDTRGGMRITSNLHIKL